MKIGIIVHSNTGHSYSVATIISKKLVSTGHNVTIQKVTAEDGRQMDPDSVKLKDIPNIDGYDMLIFGAPVWGFSLSPVMKAYLTQLKTLNGIKLSLFITQFFPFKSMGGEQSISQFKNLCEAKGGKVLGTGIVNWSNMKRKSQIENLAEFISKLK